MAQRAAEATERPEVVADLTDTDGGREDAETGPDGTDQRAHQPAPTTRFFGSRALTPGREAMDFKQIFDESLPHLGQVTVRVEIEAHDPDGYDEGVRRTVSENAATLRFEQSGFEE